MKIRLLFVMTILALFITMTAAAEEAIEGGLPFQAGERLTYDVYYKDIKIGKSVLTFYGEEELEGRSVYRITFSTDLPTFSDREDIYAHKDTFLPFRVYRVVSRAGLLCTKIYERYDQDIFKVRIEQKGRLFSKKFMIQKDTPISNAILLPCYYRTKPDLAEGERFKITLPTVSLDVVINGREKVKTPLGSYSAYIFRGMPSKFTFWLSADKKRIPVKMENYTAMDYTMVIRSIENIYEGG